MVFQIPTGLVGGDPQSISDTQAVRKHSLVRDSVKQVRALKLNWPDDINRPLASLTSDPGWP